MQIDYVEDFIEEAKHRLRQWGAEERRQLRIDIDGDGSPIMTGWDSQTIAQTIMLHGGRAPTGTGMRTEEERPEIVETDAIVSMLPMLRRDGEQVRRVLYLHYVFKTSVRGGARMARTNPRAYRDRLGGGQEFVAGMLAARCVHDNLAT